MPRFIVDIARTIKLSVTKEIVAKNAEEAQAIVKEEAKKGFVWRVYEGPIYCGCTEPATKARVKKKKPK